MIDEDKTDPMASRGPGARLKQALSVAHSYTDQLIEQRIAGCGVTVGERTS